MLIDFRPGRWQDVLADEVCDSLIADPPYGERTHEGHNEGSLVAINGFEAPIDYTHWTRDDVHAYVEHWSPRTSGWIVGMTSHDLVPAWEEAFAAAGRYAFAPLPYFDLGKAPRIVGDGPASWTVWLMVARPSSGSWLADWRERRGSLGLPCSLPGGYLRERGDVTWTPPGARKERERRKALGLPPVGKRIGGKPLGLMRRIVADYSLPGDIVCDPYAGHATTLRAALELGRRPLGAEVDPEVYAAGSARLREALVLELPGLAPAGPEQGGWDF